MFSAERFASPEYDTSKPGVVRLDTGKLTVADFYALTLSVLLMPGGILVWTLLTLLGLPCAALGKIYIKCQRRPTERFEGFGFFVFLVVCFPCFMLAGLIAWFWWTLVFALSFIATFPVLLVRLLCGQFGVVSNNFSLLAPFATTGVNGYAPLARALLGQIDRQGLIEFFFKTPFFGGGASVVAWVPIVKHLWGANPFLYELELAYINQWNGPHPTIKEPKIMKERIQLMCCRALEEEKEREMIDRMRFAPHYPYGPSKGKATNETVLGCQWLNINGNLMNFTTSTHLQDEKTISPRASLPIFRVHLNLFQFHFLTAYVEANVTDHINVEHPQWAVVPKSSNKCPLSGGYMGRVMFNFCNTLFVPFLKEVETFTIVASEDGA